MNSNMNADAFMKELFRICSSPNGSIAEISSCIYKFFRRPVIVMDASYNVLSQFPGKQIGDPIWDYQYKNRCLDANTISEYYTNRMIDALFASEGAVLVDWGPVSSCPRIACAIRLEGSVLGSMGVLCPGGVYDNSDFEYISVSAWALGIIMGREASRSSANAALHSENNLLDVMMSVLFQGKVRSMHDLELWEKHVGISLSPSYRVLALVPEKTSASQTFLMANLQKQIRLQKINMYSTLCDGVFYILFTSQKADSKDRLMLNDVLNVIQLANKYHLPFGISNSFDSLLDLNIYKYQAVRAAQLCSDKPEDVLSHFYSSVVLKDILLGGVDNIPSGSHRHPALDMLIEIDRTQSTDYYPTLVAYVVSLGSTKDTCAKLYIHRNTLTYRLNRIEEITGISLSDPATFLHILCCIYIQSPPLLHSINPENRVKPSGQ